MSKSEKAEKEDRKKKPDRGVETMFRVVTNAHERLLSMADGKAHILITVNSIILSAIIGLVLRRLEESMFLIIPTLILILVSLLSMIFSIIATRPSFGKEKETIENMEIKNVNLLFFESFIRIDLETYQAGMKNMMLDSDLLYGTLINNIYQQGIYLDNKYRTLRWAYDIFMYGLIISVGAFIIAIVLHEKIL